MTLEQELKYVRESWDLTPLLLGNLTSLDLSGNFSVTNEQLNACHRLRRLNLTMRLAPVTGNYFPLMPDLEVLLISGYLGSGVNLTALKKLKVRYSRNCYI